MVALTGRQAELKMEKTGNRGTVRVDREARLRRFWTSAEEG